MANHAKLAPSAAHRWIRCPGSVALAAQYPRTSNAYADEGTFAHGIAAECLRMESDAEHHAGETSLCGRFTVSDEMVNAIQVYLDAVRGVMLMEGGELIVEAKVTVLAPLVTGTPDAVVHTTRCIHVFDFKYGAGVFVPVDDNEQLLTYAAGVMVTLFRVGLPQIVERRKVARAQTVALDLDVVMHIVQPRCSQGAPWRSIATSALRVMNWTEDVLLVAVKAAEKPDAPLIAGDKQCRWCPAKVECPARKKEALSVAEHVFANDEPVAPPLLELLKPTELSRLMTIFPRVESWIKAVREHAYEEAQAGRTPAGFKLVDTIGTRKWIDTKNAEDALRAAGVDPFEKAKLRSPAQAEKALGKSRAAIVSKLAHKLATGIALVAGSDKRPARNPSAAFPSLDD